MQIKLEKISVRETLHFLGWRGTPVENSLMEQIISLQREAIAALEPRIVMRRFVLTEDGRFASSSFTPEGEDIKKMLSSCHEAVLLAATLGAGSERMLLRRQAKDSAQALLLDAVLSAAIESVCDQAEHALRDELEKDGLYLTDRFSPGYGDMPMTGTRAICEVLSADKAIGLTVSKSGIMIPRKSVTAVMGVSKTPVERRKSDCEICSMRNTCALARRK